MTYDTWGKLISIDGSLKDSVGIKNPYRYRGYSYYTETGVYYLQSRYYNPDIYLNENGLMKIVSRTNKNSFNTDWEIQLFLSD
jgi:RHS repeat-associated protein